MTQLSVHETMSNVCLDRQTDRGSAKFRKGKSKVQPRTGHKGPEGEKRYSSTVSLTSALDGVCGQRPAPNALPQGKRPRTYNTVDSVGPVASLGR